MPFRSSSDETRNRIMRAAVKLFAQKGYSPTTTREIVESASVTKPMLYYYFRDKQALYMSIVQNAMGGLKADLQAAVAEEQAPLDRLRRFVGAYLQFFLANREVGAICFQELFGLGENLVRELNPIAFAEIRSLLDEIVLQGRYADKYSPEDLHYISLSLLGIPNMFVMLYILHGSECDIARVTERVVDYYIAELEAPVWVGA